MQEQAELVIPYVGVFTISQSKVLQEKVGLVKPGRIGQIFFRGGQDWTEIL